jgi:hypothetical protein
LSALFVLFVRIRLIRLLGSIHNGGELQNHSTCLFTMSFLEKIDLLSRVPVLEKGGCSSWPALSKWSWDFFSSQFGDRKVRVWRQTKLGELGVAEDLCMSAFIEELKSQDEDCDVDVYCGNGPIAKVDERLLNDIVRLKNNCSGDSGNLWIGRKGHVSHLHYDSHPGLLCGIEGVVCLFFFRNFFCLFNLFLNLFLYTMLKEERNYVCGNRVLFVVSILL